MADGLIEFLGRMDQQVKIRGFRIEPGELEAVIAAQPGVTACRVAVRSDELTGKSLVAFCTGIASTRPAVMEAVQRALPSHMHPSAIVFVDALPLAPTGKVDTRALLAQLGSSATSAAPQAEDAVVAPATATEARLHQIWRELLGRERFSVTDPFFSLGGHSLLGLRLFSRLEKEFGFVRPLAVLFTHPTVRDLAAEIDRTSVVGRSSDVALTTGAAAAASHELFATLRSEGRDAPVFLIHGGDGGVMFYQALIEKMDRLDAPVFAIESPSLNNRALHVQDLDTQVTNYLAMIRAKQPEGPYRIGGYSFGGIVAFEIAARLEAMGNSVKLVLFDMINPAADPVNDRGMLRRIRVAWKRFEPDTPLERCGRILGRMATRRATNRIRQARLRRCAEAWNKGTLTDLEDRAFYLNELHQQLLEHYAPTVRVRDALLIKSAADIETAHLPADYGWGAVIDSLKFLPVPADHFTVFAAPSIEKMVPGLQNYLA